jgi:NADPH:quinone reductase
MRAIAIYRFGGPETLVLRDLPEPRPGRRSVLIKVVAAGVNPVDWKIREGRLRTMLPHRFPLVPGWDAAGTVEELGEGVTRFKRGDRVWTYARKPEVQGGTYADYLVVPEASVAKMPAKLLFEEAAAVPLAALTAWQALFEAAGLEKGMTVLVHAAAGGVGHFAVQLARNAGATVYGTASSHNHAFVMEMGAAAALDYAREDFREALRRVCPEGVDVVLDAIGGETQWQSLDVLKPGGILVSIVGRPDVPAAAARGLRARSIFVRPDASQLEALAAEVERKRLRPHVEKIYPLAEAAAAQETNRAGHVRGKLVLAL